MAEFTSKLADASRARVEAADKLRLAEAALEQAKERGKNPETRAKAIARLVEGAMRRSSAQARGAEGYGVRADAASSSGGAPPLDQVVELVRGKFEELVKALDQERLGRAAERLAAAKQPDPGVDHTADGQDDGLRKDGDLNMDPQQHKQELEKRLLARRDELTAEFEAQAAAAKKAKLGA